jgi:hypothetical protein
MHGQRWLAETRDAGTPCRCDPHRARDAGVRVEHVLCRRFGLNANPTALALTQVREHLRPLRLAAFAIDERGDQLVQLTTRHRRTLCPFDLPPSSASNRSCSRRRPREMRDITVPIGTRSWRAMSA